MLSHKSTWGVLAAVLLAACHTPATTTLAKKLVASPTAKPTGVSASKVPVVVSLLQPPAGGGTPLSGTIVIDPSYLLASGGGKIVAQGGGNIVAAGGGNIISQDGNGIISQDGNGIISQDGNGIISQDGNGIISQDGNGIISQDGNGIISQDGNGIVAQGGGNVIPNATTGIDALTGGEIVAQGGGNIVAAGGGNIISQDGNGIISQDGNGIISQDGNGIVAQGGGNYHVLAAATVPAASTTPKTALTPGQQLPAAGMLISAVSLSTHQYLPIGQNSQGKPVYVVYSNAQGAYKLYLPKGITDKNILIVANVPGRSDDRTNYNLVTPYQGTQSVAIDENTAMASRFLHLCLITRMTEILGSSAAGISTTKVLAESLLPDLVKPLFDAFIDDFSGVAQANGLDQFASKRQLIKLRSQCDCDPLSDSPTDNGGDPVLNDLAEQLGDIGLAFLDRPDTIMFPGSFYRLGNQPTISESVASALGDSLKAARDATASKLATDPTFFSHPITLQNDCGTLHPVTLSVQTATDPAAYMVKYYLTRNVHNGIASVGDFYAALGLETVPRTDLLLAGGIKIPGQPQLNGANYNNRIEAAAFQVLLTLFQELEGGTDSTTHDAAVARINTFCKAHGIQKDANASPGPVVSPTTCVGATAASGATSP